VTATGSAPHYRRCPREVTPKPLRVGPSYAVRQRLRYTFRIIANHHDQRATGKTRPSATPLRTPAPSRTELQEITSKRELDDPATVAPVCSRGGLESRLWPNSGLVPPHALDSTPPSGEYAEVEHAALPVVSWLFAIPHRPHHSPRRRSTYRRQFVPYVITTFPGVFRTPLRHVHTSTVMRC
jgi:hypothetical protein